MEAERQRESKIRQWFSMWLCKQDTGIEELFAPDAVYIEELGAGVLRQRKDSTDSV